MISKATADAKRQHKQALMQALEQARRTGPLPVPASLARAATPLSRGVSLVGSLCAPLISGTH